MNILIACESSGTVSEAFRKLGHNAVSCDLQPADDGSPNHIQGDALEAILGGKWDLVIGHPPCTYLSSSGLHWNKKRPERSQKTEDGAKFFMDMITACETIGCAYAIENPVGCMSTRWRKPDQIIQPYQFGEDASKATCLWLKGLPTLTPTQYVKPRVIYGLKRWANQTDSGQNKLGPSVDRWKVRSKTFKGIADALANQWGG